MGLGLLGDRPRRAAAAGAPCSAWRSASSSAMIRARSVRRQQLACRLRRQLVDVGELAGGRSPSGVGRGSGSAAAAQATGAVARRRRRRDRRRRHGASARHGGRRRACHGRGRRRRRRRQRSTPGAELSTIGAVTAGCESLWIAVCEHPPAPSARPTTQRHSAAPRKRPLVSTVHSPSWCSAE